MYRIEIKKYYFITAVIPALLMLFIACERTEYELLDPATAGQWILYTTADGLPGNQVRDIKMDSRQNLWITCPGYGAAKYDYKDWTYYRTTTSDIHNDGVICLDESADGSVIFGTSDGLSILSDNNTWSSYVDPTTDLFVNTIKVASNGWIWVGTRDEGFYVDNGSGFIKVLNTQYKNINVIEEGNRGNIYLGTDNGIIKWDGLSYSYIDTTSGLPDNRVTAMHFDGKERLWIGTDAGKNVSWIDLEGIHKVNLMTGTDSVRIKDICEDRRGDIWFATFRNGLIRYDGVIPHSFKEYNGFPENDIYSIAEDKNGNLWFGLYSKGLVKYTLSIDN
jgi:ligand-binding sensor domain-containing protein